MNTKQLFVAPTPIAAVCSRAFARRGAVRFLAGAAALAALAAAAPPAQASDHNARVSEYLLLQHRDARYHPNATVAEYLLQHRDERYHPNATVAEYLLLQHRNAGH